MSVANLKRISLLCVLLSSAFAPAQIREQAGPDTSQQVSPGPTPSPEPAYGKDSLSTAITGARAVLGPGDLLETGVFDTPELTQRIRVNGDGKITLALIGDITVMGMSTDDLREVIRQKLISGRFVRNPQVTVYIAEYAGQIVYVTGEVTRPGAYPLLRSHRLQDLISVAGGLTPRAGNTVTIARSSDPEVVLHLDLGDKDEAHHNPEIQPGDRVTVGLADIVYVLGDVGRPGGFLIDRRSSLSFLQALALAEGPTQEASLTNASLIHSHEPNPQPIAVNLKMILKSQSPDIPLQGGDIIWIAGSQTRNLGRLAIQTLLATASGVAIYAAYFH